jgi:hypothetical protein
METPDFSYDMNIRISSYNLALRTPHQLGFIWVVGRTFMEFCGYKKDAAITFIGSTIFHVNSMAKADMLNDIKKEYEIIS